MPNAAGRKEVREPFVRRLLSNYHQLSSDIGNTLVAHLVQKNANQKKRRRMKKKKKEQSRLFLSFERTFTFRSEEDKEKRTF